MLLLNVPGGHCVQLDAMSFELYVPAEHDTHTLAPDAVPYRPVPHGIQLLNDD